MHSSWLGVLALLSVVSCGSDDSPGIDGGVGAYRGVVLMETDSVHVRLLSGSNPCDCDFDYDVDEELGDRCESYTTQELTECAAECSDSLCVSNVAVSVNGEEPSSTTPTAADGFARIPVTGDAGDSINVRVSGCHGTIDIPLIIPPARDPVSVNDSSTGDGVRVTWGPNNSGDRACAVVEDDSSIGYCCNSDDGRITVDNVGQGAFRARVEQFWDLGSWTQGDHRAGLWQRVVTEAP